MLPQSKDINSLCMCSVSQSRLLYKPNWKDFSIKLLFPLCGGKTSGPWCFTRFQCSSVFGDRSLIRLCAWDWLVELLWAFHCRVSLSSMISHHKSLIPTKSLLLVQWRTSYLWPYTVIYDILCILVFALIIYHFFPLSLRYICFWTCGSLFCLAFFPKEPH